MTSMIPWMPAQMTLAPTSTLTVPMWVRLIEIVPNALAVVLLFLFLVDQIKCEKFVYAVLFANLFASAATLMWHGAEAAEKRR